MESSTVVAFRALVLVACLIVVPLAAIFGSQFPDVVKSVLIDRIFPNGVPGMAHEEPSRDTAPAFAAVSEAAPWPSGQTATTGPSAIVAQQQQGAGAAPAWSASGVETAAAWNQSAGQVRPAWGEGPMGGQPGAVEQAAVALPADPRQGGLPNLIPVASPPASTGPAGMAAQCPSGWTARSFHGDGASAARAGSDVLFARDVGERLSLPLQNGDCQRSDPHSTIRGDRHRSATSDGARGRAGGSLASGPASLIVCRQGGVGRTG